MKWPCFRFHRINLRNLILKFVQILLHGFIYYTSWHFAYRGFIDYLHQIDPHSFEPSLSVVLDFAMMKYILNKFYIPRIDTPWTNAVLIFPPTYKIEDWGRKHFKPKTRNFQYYQWSIVQHNWYTHMLKQRWNVSTFHLT